MKDDIQMIDLTLDVCILISGSGLGGDNNKYKNSCHDILVGLIGNPELYLAIDKRGKIEYQYRDKLKQGTLGHHFLAQMASMNKIVFIPWQNLDNGTRTQLKEAHFDPEDYKYVQNASGTKCKILSSHDNSDYSPKVCSIIKKRLGVEVKDPDECVECYC